MLPRRRLSCSGNGHRTRVLQVGQDHGRDGEHEAAHNLLGVVVELGVGETDAGAVEGDPYAQLHPHHQGMFSTCALMMRFRSAELILQSLKHHHQMVPDVVTSRPLPSIQLT